MLCAVVVMQRQAEEMAMEGTVMCSRTASKASKSTPRLSHLIAKSAKPVGLEPGRTVLQHGALRYPGGVSPSAVGLAAQQ